MPREMTSFSISEEERKRAEAKAKDLGLSFAGFIRKALEDYGKTDTGQNITVNVNVTIKFEC